MFIKSGFKCRSQVNTGALPASRANSSTSTYTEIAMKSPVSSLTSLYVISVTLEALERVEASREHSKLHPSHGSQDSLLAFSGAATNPPERPESADTAGVSGQNATIDPKTM